MRSIEHFLQEVFVKARLSCSSTGFLLGCAWLAIVAGMFGATGLCASPLHIGTVVNDVPAASFGPSEFTRAVSAAPDGTVYVGFFSADFTQLRVASSTDRGATFSPSVLVDTAASHQSFATASLVVDSAGNVFVAYIDTASNVFFAHSANSGVSFTAGLRVGGASSTSSVQVQAQGSYVYVGFPMAIGVVGLAVSNNSGGAFAAPVSVSTTGGNFGLLVDRSNGDVVIGTENASLYVRVSHDHGTTFDPEQNPPGQVFFSNWTISSDVSGRFVWVGGSKLASDNVYQIDLSPATFTSISRPAFLTSSTTQSRSLYAVGCGDVVDSVAGSWAAVHDFGTTIGTTYAINGFNQTTSVNPYSGDVLIAYVNASPSTPNIQLDVYANEVTGCGPHVSATIDDGHQFARFGQTLNYLVTVSDQFAAVGNVAVMLSTPGSALDLTHASWECIGSDNTAICPASSGAGPTLGNVSLEPATTMTWIVSVPILANTTDQTIELDVNATGAATASDIDTLVIFRSGFDVANSDGTQ